jgi:hypothetical protein
MQNQVTIVTAFFDINREGRGDGRKISEYKEWIQKTLQLNCNLYVVTEEKFKDFFVENRPKQYPMEMKIMDFKNSYYYKYYDKMKEILENDYYKNKIKDPKRVECVLPEYNIIQYSKFHYLKLAMQDNPFKSDYFFWMDAGCSRFFMDVDISKPYPSQNVITYLNNNPNKFIIQKRQDLEYFPIDDNFIWKADNLLYGTMFGGDVTVINKISEYVEHTLTNTMFANTNVNNEQLALAIVWKKHPELFFLTNNSPHSHLILFKLLSL